MVNLRMEVARFAVYLSIPVVATGIYAQPDCINWIVSQWKYITYPPQAVSREELLQKAREVAKASSDTPRNK
ncbi:hypothetical protein Poli38472_001999 [Pythium oligandrum]|uniref:Uncharacterized protein n=1 Tax=Pythium oligandrum TaxID=41045 RepID=A0A8K1CVS4_PYTOL|nr:hypothetical protein Poli38472_001999 [Pythium oligandrum]|eukprot:TMW69843.1 hypothetical protein Poli38472_001999 [Pythium oligandrum]